MSKKIVELVRKKNKLREKIAERKDENDELWEMHRVMKVKLKNMVRNEKRRREAEWSRELEKLKIGDSREYWMRLRNMAGIGKGGKEVSERNEKRRGIGEGRRGNGSMEGIVRKAWEGGWRR